MRYAGFSERINMQKIKRQAKHKRVRKNVVGTDIRPRLCVYRSSQHIYAQIVDDVNGRTLCADSDLAIKSGKKSEKALAVGESIAKKALDLKIKNIVFDRGGFQYQGRVAAVAEGARKGGLVF